MKRNDIILGIVVLIGALALLGFMKFTKVDGKRIEINIAGELYATKKLSDDETIEIKNSQGEVTNVIVIENGQAYMEEASCPDVLCIKQGRIHMTKENIVCLPNKVTVKVIDEADERIDAIAQ